MSSQQVSVKEERHDEAEIRELADKIVEANKAKLAAAAGTNNINQRVNNASTTVPTPSDKDDDYGKFGWIPLGKTFIPYLFRQGEKFCAVKMVEQKVLNKYLNYLHQDIYSCTCIRSYYITEMESKLLTEINTRHCDLFFGRDAFTLRDLVVRVSDAIEFYNFLDVCYNKLLRGTCGPKDRCGFIRINKESVVPYTVRGESKYVPLFYFEGETDNLKLKADELEGWDLSYLKFCCKVQGIRNELFANETCAVISLNDIKSYFPPGTEFEDYWPSKVVDSQLLVASKGGGQNGMWTRQPPAPPPIPKQQPQRRSPAPSAAAVSAMGLNQNIQQVMNGWAGIVGNQTNVQQMYNNSNSNSLLRQVSQLTNMQMATNNQQSTANRNQRTHQYYGQNSMPMTLNSAQIPPPLVRSTVAPQNLGGTTSTYTTPSLTPQSVSQSYMMQTLGHALMPPPGNVVAANYVQQARNIQQQQQQQQQQQAAATRNAQNRMIEQTIANARQQQQQQQKIQQQMQQRLITQPQSSPRARQDAQQPPPLIPVNGNSRYSTPPANATSSPTGADVIDLSSAPRIQGQRTNSSNITVVNAIIEGQKYTVLPDTPTQGTHKPFKEQKALVENVLVPCINMKPYIYTELLITIPDLVEYLFPKHSLTTLQQVFEVLGMKLFKGNQQQMQILREAGKCNSIHDVVPLVQIRDVMNFMPQIKYMCKGNEEPLNQPKRQRTS